MNESNEGNNDISIDNFR